MTWADKIIEAVEVFLDDDRPKRLEILNNTLADSGLKMIEAKKPEL